MSTASAETPFEIDVQTLHELRESGVEHTVLDVREAWEFDICALSGSVHVPLQQVPAAGDRLPRDGLLVVVCHHGMRSAQATRWLRAQGWDHATNLAGGIDAWARQVDTSMRTY